MLQKLSNTQIFLILLGTAIVGFFIGNFVPPFKTWFSNGGAGEGQSGRKKFTQCINGQEYISACPTCPSTATGKACSDV